MFERVYRDSYNRKQKSVLIIDDDQDAAELLAKILSDMYEARIDIARSVFEGSRLMFKNDYSLIVSDMKMPTLDGSSMIRTKALTKNAAVPILIVTGYDTKALDLPQEHLLGVLSKPFNKKAFFVAIRGLLDSE